VSVLQDQNDTTIEKYFFRNKAVSDGAISFYLDHFVRTRENRSTTATTATARPRHDPQDAKHTGERESSTQQSETTNTPTNSAGRHQKARSRLHNPGVTSEGDLSDSLEYEHVATRDQKQPRLLPSIPTSNIDRPSESIRRVQLLEVSPSYAQAARATSNDHIPTSNMDRPSESGSFIRHVQLKSGSPSYAQAARATSNDHHHPQGATEDRGSAPHQHSARRPQDTRAPPGHHSDEQQNQSQGSGYPQWLTNYFLPGGPPLKDTYYNLNDRTRDELKQARTDIQNYDRELKRRNGELHQANQIIDSLRHDNQRLTDTNRSLQNELINVHQQLEDAKNLSEVHEKELVDSPALLTKADTSSISEICEKVTALNEKIFQAAATLGDALVHKHREVSQTDLEAAAAVSQEMVGGKMTKLLIAQSQKPEPEVNPLLVQVVLQIFMVKFCVSKIQSWYPGNPAIGDFLSKIYSQIRSTGKHRIDSINQVLPDIIQ
jgi:hypothetical protein